MCVFDCQINLHFCHLSRLSLFKQKRIQDENGFHYEAKRSPLHSHIFASMRKNVFINSKLFHLLEHKKSSSLVPLMWNTVTLILRFAAENPNGPASNATTSKLNELMKETFFRQKNRTIRNNETSFNSHADSLVSAKLAQQTQVAKSLTNVLGVYTHVRATHEGPKKGEPELKKEWEGEIKGGVSPSTEHRGTKKKWAPKCRLAAATGKTPAGVSRVG